MSDALTDSTKYINLLIIESTVYYLVNGCQFKGCVGGMFSNSNLMNSCKTLKKNC